jgi:hypothetical protein
MSMRSKQTRPVAHPVAAGQPSASRPVATRFPTRTSGKAQQLTLRTTWKDPGAWGLLLVDIARHAARAYQREGRDPQEVLRRIRELCDAEWSEATDEPENLTDGQDRAATV